MGLSCDCGDDYDWFFDSEDDFRPLATTKRKRCISCKQLINIGDDSICLVCYRRPRDEIEERIYGDGGEIYLANRYFCEECGGLYMALIGLGFCVSLTEGESMRDLVSVYNEYYKDSPNDR